MPGRSLLAAFLLVVSTAFLACGGGASDAPAPAGPEPAAPTVDCATAGGLCLPNTNTAPPTYRQAKMEEGVCQRRDEICWLKL